LVTGWRPARRYASEAAAFPCPAICPPGSMSGPRRAGRLGLNYLLARDLSATRKAIGPEGSRRLSFAAFRAQFNRVFASAPSLGRPMSELTFKRAGALAMESRTDRANRYLKKALLPRLYWIAHASLLCASRGARGDCVQFGEVRDRDVCRLP
jgi:hypothetical protein